MAKRGTIHDRTLLNPLEYLREGEAIPAYVDEDGEFRRRSSINVDALLLYPRLADIHKGSTKVYFFLLSRLISNSKPINVHSSVIKLATLKGVRRERFMQYRNELIEHGLITCPKLHVYYINPLFAWTNDSAQCFDPNYLPSRQQPPRRPVGRPRKDAE